MLFNKYPYTNMHDLNLDWLLAKMHELDQKMDNFTALNEIRWVGDWDPDIAYEAWSIVRDTDGSAYISLKAVPAGVLLSNTEYWALAFDYDELYYDFVQRMDQIESTTQQAIDNALDEVNELVNQVSDDISDVQAEQAVLSARMDEFTQLPEGSTTADAELIDIRVAADGSSYSTAGDAVRGQVEYLAENIDYTRIPTGVNLLNPTTLKRKTALDGTTGEEVFSNLYSVSDFIEVSGTYFVKPFEWSGTNARIFVYRYDANRAFTVRNVVQPGDYPDGLLITHTGFIRIQINQEANTYENPWKYMVAKSSVSAAEFIPYFTQFDINESINIKMKSGNFTFTDMNDAEDNTIFYVSPSTVPDNFPSGIGAAYLLTVRHNATNKLQILYNAYGTACMTRALVNGTWGSWVNMTPSSNPTPVAGEATSSIAMFESVGCCGDSFTAGYLYNKTDSPFYDPDYVPNGEYPKIGYPAVMGRIYGIDVTAYAKGGLTSGAFRTDANGLPALMNDTPKNLYIIALGLNDVTQNVPLGVEADIDTEPATPTYLGNMGAIIRGIKYHAPDAKIILCKSLWVYNAGASTPNSYYTYISNGVDILSDHLGIPYIETLGDVFFSSDAYVNGLKGLHPTAPLYAGIGKRIGELTGVCIINNPSYFFNFYIPN